MTAEELTKEVLYDLYMVQKLSPEKIGKMVGRHGRTIRAMMERAGIPRLNNTHFRKGISATWNVGLKRTPEQVEKNRQAKLGTVPYNKGFGRVAFQCDFCGSDVFEKPYRKKSFCSAECRNKMSTLLRGETHWNYKGEKATAVQRKRNWSEYREWRASVMLRDDYTCQKCKVRGKQLTAHHLDNFAKHPNSRFDVANGVTLCWPCHWQFHRQYGHKFTPKEMCAEWLTTTQ